MRKLILIAMLCVTAALAMSAQSASAASGWHFGPLVETWINDCYTFDVVNGVGEYAGADYDADNPPKTGDVFYVNVVLQGIDSSCSEITFPEIKLPPGMSPAISAANPIDCFQVDISAGTETPDPADCPAALGAPLYGGTGSIRDPNGPDPGTWDTRAPKSWEFRIPVTASTAGTKDISFPTQVISGSITQPLEPDVTVPVAQGPTAPATGTTPGTTPAAKLQMNSAARKAKLSRRGAFSFSVTPSESGSATVTGTVSIPGGAKVVRLSKRTVKLTAGKPARVALKLSRKNAAAVRKALRHKKKVTAHVVLAGTGASGDHATTKITLRLL